jgi:hypothetical protein
LTNANKRGAVSDTREQSRTIERPDVAGDNDNEIVATLARIGAVLTSGLDLQAIG